MQDFSFEGVHQIFRVRFAVGQDKIWGQGTEIWGNFSKICIKINKNMKTFEISEKCKYLSEIFQFLVALWGTIRIIIYIYT